jgi:hypothetical protein
MTQLIPSSVAVGKKGKGARFYCEGYDLTYKASLQWWTI